MTNYYKEPKYSLKHKELNFVNTTVAVHDLHCQCQNQLKHIVLSIINQEPSLKFNKEESKKILKCLTTDGDQEEEGFGEGDLERIFDEDFGEEDAAG